MNLQELKEQNKMNKKRLESFKSDSNNYFLQLKKQIAESLNLSKSEREKSEEIRKYINRSK